MSWHRLLKSKTIKILCVQIQRPLNESENWVCLPLLLSKYIILAVHWFNIVVSLSHLYYLYKVMGFGIFTKSHRLQLFGLVSKVRPNRSLRMIHNSYRDHYSKLSCKKHNSFPLKQVQFPENENPSYCVDMELQMLILFSSFTLIFFHTKEKKNASTNIGKINK